MNDKVANAVDWLKHATDRIRALASSEARPKGERWFWDTLVDANPGSNPAI